MQTSPDIPFDEIAQRFQERVAEWVAELQPKFTSLTSTEIVDLAELATYREFRAM